MKKLTIPKPGWRRAGLFAAAVVLSALLLWGGHLLVAGGDPTYEGENPNEYIKAEVVEILSRTENNYSLDGTTTLTGYALTYRARVLGGDLNGQEVLASQSFDPFVTVQVKQVEPGDRVVLYREPSTFEGIWFTGDYTRTDILLPALLIFGLLLVLYGRSKGLSTLLSLVFTVLAVFVIFVPAVLSGHNVYLWSVLICLYIVGMTILLVNGANKLGLAAALGCAGGILLSGVLTLGMGALLNLTGVTDESSMSLTVMTAEGSGAPVDLKAVVFGAIIIGAIGAIMDVAISLAAALHEVQVNAPAITRREMIRSGFAIGRNMLGTMANTLILAYIGSSLPALLLLHGYNHSLLYLLNIENVVIELMQALIGSTCILFALPITTLLCAVIYVRHKQTPVEAIPAA